MKSFQLRIFLKTMVVFCLLYCALSIAAYGEIIFQEDFENGLGLWHADNGVWEIGVPTYGPANAHSLSNCAATVLGGHHPEDTDSRFISNRVKLPEINDNEEIVLSFYHYFAYNTRSSKNEGRIHVKHYNNDSQSWSGWTDIGRRAWRESKIWSWTNVLLNNYAGKTIMFAFYHSSYSKTHIGWYVDDIQIEKRKIKYFSGIETFEEGWGGWCADNGVWEVGQSSLTPDSSGSDKSYIGTILDGNYPEDNWSCLKSPYVQVPYVKPDEQVSLIYNHYFDIDSSRGDDGQIYLSNNSWSEWKLISNIKDSSKIWSRGLIDLTEYSGETLRVQFCIDSDGGSDKGWYIDEVKMYPPPKPYLPYSPSPHDPLLEKILPIMQKLSWNCLDSSVSENAKFHVYLGKDTPSSLESIAQNLTQTTFQPEQLEFNTVYYWKIVSIDPENNEYQGPVWKFKTDKEPDTTPPPSPSNLIASIPAGTYTQNNIIHISWAASDDGVNGSGVAGYDFVWSNSSDTTPNGDVDTTETECTSPELNDGSNHWFHIQCIDNEYNISEIVHLGPFLIDLTPPIQGQVFINNGDKYTSHQNVVLNVSADDKGAGMGWMKFSNQRTEWSSPVRYSESVTIDWELIPGIGDREVCVLFSDKVGNWNSEPFCSSIIIDPTPPPDVTDLIVDETRPGKVFLSWKQILDPSDVTYKVYRSESEHGIFYPINSGKINHEDGVYGRIKFEDLNLKTGTEYFYKVKSFLGNIESIHFSDIVMGTPKSKENFEIKILNPSQIKPIYGTTEYDIQVIVNDSANLSFNCIGLPEGIDHQFLVLQGQDAQPSDGNHLSNISTSCSLSLLLSIGSASPVGRYSFKVRVYDAITAEQYDYTLSLSVISETSYGIVLNVISTADQRTASQYLEIPKGYSAKIYGSIFPILSEKTVTLYLKHDDNEITKTIQTDSNGEFEDMDWLKTKDLGTYQLKASWTDSHSNVHTSEIFLLTIIKGNSTITCQRRIQQIESVDTEMTVSGELFPPANQPYATLRFFRPGTDSHELYKDYTISQDFYTLNGDALTYSIKDTFFDQKGIWTVKAYWEGNDTFIGCESHPLKIPVDVDYGRAIIIGGGIKEPQNTFWDITQKLSATVYRHFKHFSFSHDMIYLMLNTEVIDDVWNKDNPVIIDDSTPTVAEFKHAIEHQFTDQLNEDNPLFIYMFGHTTEDVKFQVFGHDEMISAHEIDDSLDVLQAEKENVVVVLIIETCFSGKFIQTLSGQNRIIITCSGDKQYRLDASGENAFSGYLFRKLREGDRLEKAFEYAKRKYINLGYDSPQLDDNGDASADSMDGYQASKIEMVVVASPSTKIKAMYFENIVDSQTEIPIQVEAIQGEQQIDSVVARLIPSDTDLNENQEVIQLKEFKLIFNQQTGYYEGFLNCLNRSGLYKVIVSAQDIKGDISLPEIAYITVKNVYDINQDCNMNLLDIITGLQILTQIQTTSLSSFTWEENTVFELKQLIQLMQTISQ